MFSNQLGQCGDVFDGFGVECCCGGAFAVCVCACDGAFDNRLTEGFGVAHPLQRHFRWSRLNSVRSWHCCGIRQCSRLECHPWSVKSRLVAEGSVFQMSPGTRTTQRVVGVAV